MVTLEQSYVRENWKLVSCQDAAAEAANSTHKVTTTPSGSPLSTALSHIRLIGCNTQPDTSNEDIVPLTSSTTCSESLCRSSTNSDHDHPIKLSINEPSFVDVRREDHLGPCSCSAVAMQLACNGPRDRAAWPEQLLRYNLNLQGLTWITSGSIVHPSPFGSISAARSFSSACSRSTGGGMTEMLIHGPMLFTAHKDYHIRVWKVSPPAPSSSVKLNLLSTLPTVRDYLLNRFCERNYVQVRRHHRCLWIKHADNISALAVAGSCPCPGQNGQSADVNAELLYSASWDKTFKVWRLSDYKCMESVVAHTDAITAIVVHRSQLLYTASCDGTVKVWTKETIKTSCTFLKLSSTKIRHRLVATLQDHKCAVNALAISRDGMILFSAGSDGIIRMWRRSLDNIEHGVAAGAGALAHMNLCSTVEGHKRAVLCLNIVGNDQVLLSGSADKTVRAWCVGGLKGKVRYIRSESEAAGGSLLATLKGHRAAIKWVRGCPCVHGRGYTIYSGALDTSIKVWWLQAQNT